MKSSLYLLLDICSFIIPFLYSFEKKRIYFIKHWKPYFISIGIVGVLFIFWDILFTHKGVWGFNDDYLVGFYLFKLPLEEWLFFLLIPYASNFIHYSLEYFFPKPRLSEKTAHKLSLFLFVISFSIAIGHINKIYTVSSFGLFSIFMLLQLKYKFAIFRRYILSFLIILIPFFIVNSILTGSIISEPIVWYNNHENLGFRIGTVPIEDFFYCFSMLYGSILIFEKLKK